MPYDHIKNNVNHARTKHIHRRHHFIRDAYRNSEIELIRIPGKDQAADVLTKPLSKIQHAEAINLLNMQAIHIPRDA